MKAVRLSLALLVSVIILFPLGAWSATLTLTASDTGFVTSTGGSSKFDGLITTATFNYSTGWEEICPAGGLCSPPFIYGEKKSYFVFADLSSVSDTVVGATLFLDLPASPAPGGYESSDPAETFIISKTGVPLSEIEKLKEPTSPGEITATHITAATGVFTGLTDDFDASGTFLGTVDLADTDEGSTVAIPLSSGAVDHINTAILGGSPLIFGGKVTSLAEVGGTTEEVFSFTDTGSPGVTIELVTIPLPAAAWLFTSGLRGLFGIAGYRKA